LELNSGATGKLKSLQLYMDMVAHKMAVRFCAAKLSIENIVTPKGTSYYLLTMLFFSRQNKRILSLVRERNRKNETNYYV
jgi:uncharacterized protein